MADEITMYNINVLLRHKETEDKQHDTDIPPNIHSKNWPKIMDVLEEYLSGLCEVNGVPISYLIRIEILPYYEEENNSTGFMIHCMPIRPPELQYFPLRKMLLI